MEVQSDFLTQQEALEQQELTSADGVAPLDVYKKLLLIYLMESDLTNAKFLWKRIPSNLKTDNELVVIWQIGQSLWKKEFANVYFIINSQEWSEEVKELTQKLYTILQKRMTKLVADSYSVIKLEALSKLVGISDEQQLKEYALSNSWEVDSESKLVKITRNKTILKTRTDSPDRSLSESLLRLTNYVSFLEN